jgi:hypothetical protein
MQQEETSLRGDRHPDLVRQLQSRATFEALLRQEDLHMLEQFLLVGRGQPPEDRHVAGDDLLPLRRERCGPESFASESFTLGDFHRGSGVHRDAATSSGADASETTFRLRNDSRCRAPLHRIRADDEQDRDRRRRALVIFAAASLVAVACGAATLAASGVPSGSWIRNPVASLAGLVLATGLMFLRRSLQLARVLLGVAIVAVATSFLAPAREGVHR